MSATDRARLSQGHYISAGSEWTEATPLRISNVGRMAAKQATPAMKKQSSNACTVAAVDLADRDGIEVVTMRRLGQQLGVEAMSLYNHVADKDDLLNGMVDLVIGEIGLREAGFTIRAAGPAYSLQRSYTYGFALHEQSMPVDTPEDAADALRRKFLRDVSAEEYPYLAELLVEHIAQQNVSHDRSFNFGLELILDGLERVRDGD